MNTSESILACARQLIAAGGYNGFSYADIADTVGIRKPSIHHHFPTKVDLVRTLVKQYREAAEAGIGELQRHVKDPAGQLRAYVGYWEACIGDASAPFCICALLAGEMPLLPDQVAAEVRAHFRFLSTWLTSVLERGAAEQAFRLVQPARTEAEVLMAAVHGAMLSARAHGDAAVFSTVMHAHLARLATLP